MSDEFKSSMMLEFDMSDLGKMRYVLGIEVIQNAEGIFMCQRRYAREILSRFEMENSNSVLNPIVPGTKLSKDDDGTNVDATLFKQLVGSLMYLTTTRPDLMYGVSLISRFMACPKESYWRVGKKILRYLRGTTDVGIFYKKNSNRGLKVYTDSDYAGDLNDRKSTSGFVFLLGSAAVSWSSKKQPIVSLSTTEAEYIATTSCACQYIWVRRVLKVLGHEEENRTLIQCDNISTIKLSKNAVSHGRSKHIDVRFHFLRDLVKDEIVELSYCSSQDQVVDIMTKPLKLDQFLKFRTLLGLMEAYEIN